MTDPDDLLVPPTRSRLYPCRCRIRLGSGHFTSCMAWVRGPDQPICDECLNSRHPESEGFDPWVG